MNREPWDFDWMLAAVQSLETYEAALETAEVRPVDALTKRTQLTTRFSSQV
ncbi:hypothetical protein DVH05_005730 [Phytophthora capsici]|nr:hypothetical protein DVH05_005730 [Phytophthora capsici]